MTGEQLQQLKLKIESAPQLALLWDDVFPFEEKPKEYPHPGLVPEFRIGMTQKQMEEVVEFRKEWDERNTLYQPHARWVKIMSRFGELKPDAAYEIAAYLTAIGYSVGPQDVIEARKLK